VSRERKKAWEMQGEGGELYWRCGERGTWVRGRKWEGELYLDHVARCNGEDGRNDQH